jgi:hypothetical protein
MKTLSIIIMALMINIICLGQDANISFQMRGGYALKQAGVIIAPAVNFKAHGFAMSPEMIVNASTTQAVNFGLKLSYQYKFIEVGYGKYFDLYSTDKFDLYRNGFSNLLFVDAHYKNYFFEVDNLLRLTIGARFSIINIQN